MRRFGMARGLCLVLLVAFVFLTIACEGSDFKKATELFQSEQYEEARVLFEKLGEYENSTEMVKECDYQLAVQQVNKGNYDEALLKLEKLGAYKDSADLITECKYQNILKLIVDQDYKSAIEQLNQLGDYKDCSTLLGECKWRYVLAALGSQGIETKASYNEKDKTVVLDIQIIPDNGDILITSTWKDDSMVSTVQNCNIRIKKGSIDAEITADSSIVYIGQTALPKASGHFNISQYTKGMAIAWDKETKGELKFSTGKLVVALDPPTEKIAAMVECLNTQLSQIAPLATMADLGFEAY